MKIPNKRKLMQIAINHSSDINTKDLLLNLNITNDDYQRSN